MTNRADGGSERWAPGRIETQLGECRSAPAALRNRDAILAILERWLESASEVLEIGSGTGQHASHFARAMSHLSWQPSDRDSELFDTIAAWAATESVTDSLSPIVLDVTSRDWPVDRLDAIYSANMIHIAPWEACLGLLDGAARHLRPGGQLILYGPFVLEGVRTAPSNEAFDESLRSRDPRWGVRDLKAVTHEADARGLSLQTRESMPANNQMVCFRRS